ERQSVEEEAHVVEGRDRDPDPADLAPRKRRVAVVPHLRRQIERDAQSFVAVREEVLESLVRLLRRPEARVLPHRPEAASIHRRADAPRERRFAGKPDLGREILRRLVRGREDYAQRETASRLSGRRGGGR